MNTRTTITTEMPYIDQDGINKALKDFNGRNTHLDFNLTERTSAGLLRLYKKCHDFTMMDGLSSLTNELLSILEYRIFPGHKAYEIDMLNKINPQNEMPDEAEISFSEAVDFMFTIRTLINFISDVYTEVAWIERFNEKQKTD